MARVTRPGGKLAFTTWGQTPAGFSEIEDAWRVLYPDTAPSIEGLQEVSFQHA
jgi:hypothetical protein